jgi:hypothetical protein
MKARNEVRHSIIFAQRNHQSPDAFDQKNVTTASDSPNFPQNCVNMNFLPPAAGGGRGNRLPEEKRINFVQRQQVFLEAAQEAGVGAGAGTKGFDGQGVAARLAQMSQEQSRHDRFSNPCVRARDEDDLCHRKSHSSGSRALLPAHIGKMQPQKNVTHKR